MPAYPGIGGRRVFLPNVEWNAGEDEFVVVRARAAAQAIFVPVDPDLPVFAIRQGRLKTCPIVAHPLGHTLRPKGQIRQGPRIGPFNSRCVGSNLLPAGGGVGGGGGVSGSVGGVGGGVGRSSGGVGSVGSGVGGCVSGGGGGARGGEAAVRGAATLA